MTKPTDHWYTPNTPKHPVIDIVVRALGHSKGEKFGLDPTSDPTRRTRALVHFTEEDNCLTRKCPDGLTIFCNPPFGNPLPFVLWVAEQVESGACPQAVMLLKSGTTHNKGTGEIIQKYATATCSWRHNGRIDFEPGPDVIEKLRKEYEEGKRKTPNVSTANFDCTFVNFGEWRHFLFAFRDFGHVQICDRVWRTNLTPPF